jgi:hypothetical protein
MATTVAGLARVQGLLNTRESSYESWYVFPGRLRNRGVPVSVELPPLQHIRSFHQMSVLGFGSF